MLKVGFLAALIVAATASFAQTIAVYVNGEPVRFTGVAPQRIDGRVLVPLRGVMEKMGAYVSYQASTKTVTAQRGDVDLQLTLGQRRAIVNGRDVMLDVPAMEYRGSTLVPLRFMGEALGAEVRWDPVNSAVQISTAGVEPNPTDPPATGGSGAIDIERFDVDAPTALRAGSTIEFTLRGTPGGTAMVQIPGVVKDIALRETTSGVYQGSYTIPNTGTAVTVSRATAIARLTVGRDSRLIQSGTSFQVDNQPPTISAATPDANGRVNSMRPNITAVFSDQSGTGVDASAVKLLVDGRNVTADATVTESLLAYRPTRDLGAGRHEVELEVLDRAGNRAYKTWVFTVVDRASVITSFTHDASRDIRAGDEINFTLQGEPGGTVVLQIGDLRSLNMTESAPGKYTATYVVRRTDRLDGIIVTAKMTTKSGESFTTDLTLGSRVQGAATLASPTITSHENNASVGRLATFKGKADADAVVRIKIDFTQRVFGAIPMNGTIAEIEVEADRAGNWTTKEIDLDTGLGRDNITYTITVVAVGADDKVSDPTKITLKR